MKFKVDENLPDEVRQILAEAGYDALNVLDQQLGGTSDQDLTRICQTEQRILISLDTDFADIRAYPPAEQAGIIVLRLKQQDKDTVLAIVRRLIKLLATEAVGGRLWIVDEQRLRIRN